MIDLFEARAIAYTTVARDARLQASRASKAAMLAAQPPPPSESLNLQDANRPERQLKALRRNMTNVSAPQEEEDEVAEAETKPAPLRKRRKRGHVVSVSQGNYVPSKICNPFCSHKKHCGGHPDDLHKCKGQVADAFLSLDDDDDDVTVPKRMRLQECSSNAIMPLAEAEDFLARFLHDQQLYLRSVICRDEVRIHNDVMNGLSVVMY